MKKSLFLILFLLSASFAFSQVDYNNTKDEKLKPKDNTDPRQAKYQSKQVFGTATPRSSAVTASSKKLNPQDKAEKLLNTSFIPPDFPKFYEGTSERDYEEKVAKWFAINPDKRRTNK